MIFFFALLVTLIFICFIAERKVSWLEIYTSTFFACWLRLKVDGFLAYKYHYYYYFDGGISYYTIFFFPLFGAVNYLVINWFPYEANKGTKVFYILSWTAWSIFIEIASVLGGFFHYDGWQILYSIIWYPLLIIMLITNIHIIRYLKKGDRQV
jgi:hypothetical protein